MKISQHFEIQYVLLIGFCFHFNKLEKFLSLLKSFGQKMMRDLHALQQLPFACDEGSPNKLPNKL